MSIYYDTVQAETLLWALFISSEMFKDIVGEWFRSYQNISGSSETLCHLTLQSTNHVALSESPDLANPRILP